MPLDPARWADRPTCERHWADAKSLDDDTLSELLEVAEGDCLAYGPALVVDPAPLPDPMPTRWILASIMQAREIRQAGMREGDVIGVGDYAIRSRPLTGAVKQMLRPAGAKWTTA
jgi:hypothetical protein